MPRIETARTILRPFEEYDAEGAFQWFGDAEAMHLDPGGPDRSVAETKARLRSYIAHQRQHGFSRWIVLSREDGRPIGHAGLMVLGNTGEIELGYRLLPAERGKGLATEICRAWIDHARDRLGLGRIVAFTHRENRDALRVMERLGMRFVREMRLPPREALGSGREELLDVLVYELRLSERLAVAAR